MVVEHEDRTQGNAMGRQEWLTRRIAMRLPAMRERCRDMFDDLSKHKHRYGCGKVYWRKWKSAHSYHDRCCRAFNIVAKRFAVPIPA